MLRRSFALLSRSFGAIGVGRMFGAGLLAVFLSVRAWDPLAVETLRLKLFDLYQQIQPRQVTQQAVIIVDVDDESLAEFGQWPWPRDLTARLVAKLSEAGAAVIGFDIVFAEPDRLSPSRLADSLPAVDEDVRAALRQLPSNDQALAEAIGDAPVVLGHSGHPRRLSARERPLGTVPLVTLGGDPRPYLFTYSDVLRNLPELEAAAPGQGIFNFEGERDGLVRRVPALVVADGKILPTLSLEMLRLAAKGGTYVVKSDELGILSVGLAGMEIPTDRFGRIWVNYSLSDPEKYISASDVLQGRVPSERLSGRLVLIGTSAVGLLDIKATPVHRALPGVEVHAQILETVLTQSYLLRPSYALGAELLLQALTGVLMILLVPVMGAFFSLLLGAAISGALVAGSWYLFTQHQLLIDVSYGLVGSGLVYIVLVFVNYFREEGRRRQVRGAFGQYLAPALVDQLARDPRRLVLGGETKTMTFLFCDVRGFTAISESYKSDPQGLTSLINRFLTPLTGAILQTNGTIDKYMGDAIMAFWNAPLDDPEHAMHAGQSALDMLRRLEVLNAERQAEAAAGGQAFLPLKIGIGINTGACVVGNMGSDQRFDYSVLGDSVNLASRLEGQSKTYGVAVIVGETTAREIEADFALLELDLIRVKGKSEPERIFTLMGDGTLRQTAAFKELEDRNAALLGHYRAGNWTAALEEIEACRELEAAAGLTDLLNMHAARCRAFQTEAPPPGWDGVFEAETK